MFAIWGGEVGQSVELQADISDNNAKSEEYGSIKKRNLRLYFANFSYNKVQIESVIEQSIKCSYFSYKVQNNVSILKYSMKRKIK